MTIYVLTGSNRGIGLEYARQISSSGSNTIYAGVRSMSNDLADLKSYSNQDTKIEILECDTANPSSIESFAKNIIESLNGEKVDVVINNAGINANPAQTSLDVDAKDMTTHINVNVLGPQKLTALLSSHLSPASNGQHPVIVNLTSGLGSCSKGIVKCTTYAISKAALNMLTVHQAGDLEGKGVRVICMDPGWVKTRMGGDGALITAEESVGGQLKTVEKVAKGEDGGRVGVARFFQYNGEEVGW